MRCARLLFTLVALGLFSSGCTHSSTSEASGQAATEGSPSSPATPVAVDTRAKGPVIATIVTHDAKVSVHGRGAAQDLRVVVRKSDGTLVADGLSLEQLRATDPALHMLVTTAVASKEPEGGYIDATNRRSAPPLHGGLGF